MNEMTTLGDVLGADPVDAGELTELTEEYLMMIHGGNTQSVPPPPPSNNERNAESAADQLIRYIDQKFGPSMFQVPLLINVIVPPKPIA